MALTAPASGADKQPGPFPAAEVKAARQALKYCTRPGYFDHQGNFTDQVYIRCAKQSMIAGNLAQAKAWRDAASAINAAREPGAHTYQAELLLLNGDLAYFEGDWLKARDIYREIYRNQLELDVMQEDAGDYGSLNGLLDGLTVRLQDRVVEDTRTAHPDIYPTLKALWDEMQGFWAGKPRPADWTDFEARARKVLAADPKNEIGYRALVEIDFSRGDCAGQIRDGQGVLDNARYDSEAGTAGMIGFCHLQAKHGDLAAKYYAQAIASAPWQPVYRENRDIALEQIEKRDHPKAFDFYVAARDGTAGIGKPATTEQLKAAWDNINQSLALSPNFPLALALRARLYSQNYLIAWADDHDAARRAADADAIRAYALNPESLESIFAMGLVFYRKPKDEFKMTMWRSMEWFNLHRTRSHAAEVSTQFFDLASKARYALSYEEERQREADNAAYAKRMEELRRIQDEQERKDRTAPSYSDNMRAWCNSIGAANIQIMAAVPPACYAYVGGH